MKNIFIIGSGAIGKALAVSLASENKKSTILRGSVDDGSTSSENMEVVLPDNARLNATIEVSSLSNYKTLDGIIVLTNKSFGNSALAKALRDKAGNSPVVLLQNGLGVEQPFIDAGFSGIYRCVLFVTSQAIANNTIRFKPVSVCPVGIIAGGENNLANIVDQLNTHHFPFKTEPAIQHIIWKKAIINSVFNSVCPLLNTDNGIFKRNAEALIIAKRVVKECLAVAALNNIQLEETDVIANLLSISKASDGQLISTLQDINNKRPTEIDTLNFEIVRLAEQHGKGDLVPETKLLGELTGIKSALNR